MTCKSGLNRIIRIKTVKPGMVFRGEEVNRSVRKNRVMKEKNLQKWLSDKANDKSESPQGNYDKSKPDGQVRIRVAPRPDELLDATWKRSIVQIIRIKIQTPERVSEWRGSRQVGSQESGNEGKETCKSGWSDKAKINLKSPQGLFGKRKSAGQVGMANLRIRCIGKDSLQKLFEQRIRNLMKNLKRVNSKGRSP